MFNVMISEQLTAADFPGLIKRFYINNLFKAGAFITCIPYHCYDNFQETPKIKKKHTVTSTDRSNLKL